MTIVLAIALVLFPAFDFAAPDTITFNLRDPAIELIDEVNSLQMNQVGTARNSSCDNL